MYVFNVTILSWHAPVLAPRQNSADPLLFARYKVSQVRKLVNAFMYMNKSYVKYHLPLPPPPQPPLNSKEIGKRRFYYQGLNYKHCRTKIIPHNYMHRNYSCPKTPIMLSRSIRVNLIKLRSLYSKTMVPSSYPQRQAHGNAIRHAMSTERNTHAPKANEKIKLESQNKRSGKSNTRVK